MTFVVLAGAVAAAVAWRDTVIGAWPSGSRILAATGQAEPQHANNPGRKPE